MEGGGARRDKRAAHGEGNAILLLTSFLLLVSLSVIVLIQNVTFSSLSSDAVTALLVAKKNYFTYPEIC